MNGSNWEQTGLNVEATTAREATRKVNFRAKGCGAGSGGGAISFGALYSQTVN